MARRRNVLRAGLGLTALGLAGCTQQSDDSAADDQEDDDEDDEDEETEAETTEGIETDGTEARESEETSYQSGEQVTNRLQVLQAAGLKTETDGEMAIGGVTLIATKAPGAGDIDLTGVTMQWVDDTGTYDIVHEDVYEGRVDGTFAHQAIKDEDDSLTGDGATITSADDRARIVVDIGGVEPVGSNSIAEAYAEQAATTIRSDEGGLPEGAAASVRITTAEGTATTVQLLVPESLSGRRAVRL